jgi:drug/metabolite transporter (DMT)-like permease
MNPTTRPLDAFAICVTVVLCLSWGFTQVAVKLALADIPPLIQAALRSAGAAVIVGAWTFARGIPLFKRDNTLVPGIAAGLFFGLEFLLIYRGLLWTTASRAVLFIYLAPFFVVLGARWFLPADASRPRNGSGSRCRSVGWCWCSGCRRPRPIRGKCWATS